MMPPIYTREQAKAHARSLRAERNLQNRPISHSVALELVAAKLGFSNWNTLSAHLSNTQERPLQVGDRVQGCYLKKSIAGCVLGVQEISGGDAYQVTLEFDSPVDVVTSEVFSNFRKRVCATVSANGVSYQKTSDGVPHLVVAIAGSI